MSAKEKNNSRSSKPRFVYLDKFERFKLKTNKMLGDLEAEQDKSGRSLKFWINRMTTLRRWIRALSVAVVIEMVLIVYLILTS